jgi:hypothetical protein
VYYQKKPNGCASTGCLALLVVIAFLGLVIVAPMVERYKTPLPLPQWFQQLQHLLPGASQSSSGSKSTTHSTPHSSTRTMSLSAPSGSCFNLARAAAAQAGIDPTLYARQINQESGCQSTLCSPAGACGAAQLMPEMAASLGVDLTNVQQSLTR